MLEYHVISCKEHVTLCDDFLVSSTAHEILSRMLFLIRFLVKACIRKAQITIQGYELI